MRGKGKERREGCNGGGFLRSALSFHTSRWMGRGAGMLPFFVGAVLISRSSFSVFFSWPWQHAEASAGPQSNETIRSHHRRQLSSPSVGCTGVGFTLERFRVHTWKMIEELM